MSLGQDIDYEALARQHGAISSVPAAAPGTNGEIDYEAIAKQHGAISSQPAPQTSHTTTTRGILAFARFCIQSNSRSIQDCAGKNCWNESSARGPRSYYPTSD